MKYIPYQLTGTSNSNYTIHVPEVKTITIAEFLQALEFFANLVLKNSGKPND